MTHFNQVANQWDTPEKIQLNQKYADEIKSMTARHGFKKILEVGCGTGLLGSFFMTENNEFLGIDTSSGMLDVFNKKFGHLSKVKSALLNLEDQELNEKEFDLIISTMAFHHLVSPQEMLLKLKDKLTADGFIAIIDLDQEDGTFHPDPVKMGVHHFGFSAVENAQWAAQAGLKMKERKIIHTTFKNEKAYPIFVALYTK
jgi:predicted TPR repeat methyltransferase